MTKKRTDIEALAKGAGVRSASDRLTDAAADGISILVPYAGPIAASIMRQVAPRDTETYVTLFAEEAARRIVELEADKVDRSYFESEEWAADVGQVIDSITDRRNRSKRDHYLAALAHAATTDRPDEVERHRFLDLLDRVRLSHLRLLAVVAARERRTEAYGTIDDMFRAQLTDQDVENIRLDWADLQQAGILAAIPTGLAITDINHRVWDALPAIGRRFAAFIAASESALTGPPSPSV